MHDISKHKVVFRVVYRGGLLVCQRVDEFRLPVVRYQVLILSHEDLPCARFATPFNDRAIQAQDISLTSRLINVM